MNSEISMCSYSYLGGYYIYTYIYYAVTELEGKDVEDLFTAVLSPSTSQPPPPPQVPHHQGPGSLPATPGTSMPHPNTGTSLVTLSCLGWASVVLENPRI